MKAKQTKRIRMIPREMYESWFHALHTRQCLLCDPSQQIIIKSWDKWLWIVNISPYFEYHTMVVPKRHILDLGDITIEEFAEFKKVYFEVVNGYAKGKFKHQDGKPVMKHLWFVRSRDMNFDHSADISRPEHLHIHVSPDYKGFFDPILHKDAYMKEGFEKGLK